MGQITGITQKTENRFVNLYELETIKKTGRPGRYFVSSRAKNADELKIRTRDDHPDGVMIYMLYGEKKDRIVLVRQYRFAIDDYIYELPAGLCEKGESYRDSAVREAKEETGLTMTPIEVPVGFEKPYYMTVGMTDECVAFVYGFGEGEITDKYLESGEEIEVILADREEARRILREEKAAMTCAMSLMHFIHDEEPFAFLRETL